MAETLNVLLIVSKVVGIVAIICCIIILIGLKKGADKRLKRRLDAYEMRHIHEREEELKNRNSEKKNDELLPLSRR